MAITTGEPINCCWGPIDCYWCFVQYFSGEPIYFSRGPVDWCLQFSQKSMFWTRFLQPLTIPTLPNHVLIRLNSFFRESNFIHQLSNITTTYTLIYMQFIIQFNNHLTNLFTHVQSFIYSSMAENFICINMMDQTWIQSQPIN